MTISIEISEELINEILWDYDLDQPIDRSKFTVEQIEEYVTRIIEDRFKRVPVPPLEKCDFTYKGCKVHLDGNCFSPNAYQIKIDDQFYHGSRHTDMNDGYDNLDDAIEIAELIIDNINAQNQIDQFEKKIIANFLSN